MWNESVTTYICVVFKVFSVCLYSASLATLSTTFKSRSIIGREGERAIFEYPRVDSGMCAP
jgi:hypothetical protein